MNNTCYYCGVENGSGPNELRPYGPNGSYVCANCILGDGPKCKKREKLARENYQKLLRDALKKSKVVVLTPNGPKPIGEE